MRRDHRPYWLKKAYLRFRFLFAEYFLRPRCDSLGPNHTIMKPWHVKISGPNIDIGHSITIVGEAMHPVDLCVWGRAPELGKLTIGDCVLISPGVRISASDEIVIGNNVMLAHGVYITDSDWHGVYDRIQRDPRVLPVHIGDNAWLGDHAVVLKGVSIGENSIVAARSVVSKDVPANVVVAGNPARVVKELDGTKDFVTRAHLFTDSQATGAFFDGVDQEVLKDNTVLKWLRVVFFPTTRD